MGLESVAQVVSTIPIFARRDAFILLICGREVLIRTVSLPNRAIETISYPETRMASTITGLGLWDGEYDI